MESFGRKLKNEAQRIRLTAGEKIAMRTHIFGTKVPSPYVAYSFQLTALYRYALASLAAFIVIGGGTVSAAQAALPGDLLYSVKTAVNERVELALAMSVERKIEIEERLAGRRVAEAELLEARGRLNEGMAATLEHEFERHARRALALAGKIPHGGMSTATVEEDDAVLRVELMIEDGERDESSQTPETALVVETATTAATATPLGIDMRAGAEEEDELSVRLLRQRGILRKIKERVEERGRNELRGRGIEVRQGARPDDLEDSEPPSVRVDVGL